MNVNALNSLCMLVNFLISIKYKAWGGNQGNGVAGD